MKNRKIIVMISSIILLIALGIAIYFVILNGGQDQKGQTYVKVQEDGTKVGISPKLSETKEIDGLEITDLTLTESGNITKLLGTITNKSEQEKGDYIIIITFLDKKGNEMTTIEPYVKKLQPGESTKLNASTTFDYTNTYDISITKK